VLGLPACTKKTASQDDVRRFFADHQIGSSADYAIVRNGDDYLLTIHGYIDDREV
jgi:hypothetical protein